MILDVSACYVKESESRSVMSDSLQLHGLNSLGQNTGVGRLSLLHWHFLTQESNWGLLPCRQILYQLSYQGINTPSKRHGASPVTLG